MKSKTSPCLRAAALALILGSSAIAAVTPGGTFTDKAIITIDGSDGGETLASGATLVHDFNVATTDGSYEHNPSAGDPTQIALSSGRHLVLYNTRFDDLIGGINDRSEFQTYLTLDGAALVAGRSQGFIRQNGGADETVMSGGAIITVADDNDIVTLETLRSDNDTEANLPFRVAGQSAIQFLKLDDGWDYLSAERASDQAGTVGDTSIVDVEYDTLNPSSNLGSAFAFTPGSGDITLNETGLYLVFASTSLQKLTNTTRTNFVQSLTLDGSPVAGSKTTTYLRGNEDTNDGVAAVGLILSAVAGQTLNVEVIMEPGGSDGTVQGGETAISIIKLPPTAKHIEVTDTTDQNVLNGAATPIGFDTLNSPANSTFSHSGGSTVTVNDTTDYLFFGSLLTESDAANDNNDRVIPIHGFQIDGAGGPLSYGQGSHYNRDQPQNRISGSWGAAILGLTSGQTVEMTSQNVGTASAAFPNTPVMQGLSIDSLLVSNDPAISVNLPLSVEPNQTATITDAFLDTFDNDTPPTGLTYTVGKVPLGGTLNHTIDGPIDSGDSFTQDDIDNGRVEFVAGSVETSGGFDFTVSDGSGSDASSFAVEVAFPTTVVTITGGGSVIEGDTAEWTVSADVAPIGADLTVGIIYSGTASDGSDFNGVASVVITDGTTAAALDVDSLVDGLFEGFETITASIGTLSGATVTPVAGTPSSSTVIIEDGDNAAPTATNLTQVIVGTGTLPIADITVTDPDAEYDSQVVTAGDPLFRTNGITNLTVYSDGRPDATASHDLDATGPALSEAAGFSVEVAFIPQAADLTGVVQVWEIGGSSNGSVLVLIDGIPHISVKANGTAANTPVDTGDPGFVDTDWATGNQVVVPLTAVPLTAGLPTRIALVFDITGNTVKSSVNGSTELITNLTPQSGTNFRGDHTVNTGSNAGTGTGSSNSGTGILGTTAPAVIRNLAGGTAAVSSVRFWNESGGNAVGTPGAADSVTATLTINGWSSAANGTLTTAGGGSFAAGEWSVTGDVATVNAALAAVEFVTGGSTADPTLIAISIEDGDEDGSGPTTGTIVVTAVAPDPIYVDDNFAGNIGDPIADGDLGTPGNQPAILGLSAFTTLSGGVGAATPTGTIIVNDGDYSTENVSIADSVTLIITDTAGPVQVGDIATGVGNSIEIQGSNTLELGATNITGPGIDCPITGIGNLHKVGTGRVITRVVCTYSGTTTVDDGFLRVGFRSADSIQSELAGDGPVVVNAPGRIEFNVDVDKTISQTGAISGTGSVATLGDGTLIFDGPANSFSGGFELGDGATSSFDGVNQGAVNGFVVVNDSDHLGSGLVRSRGSQLQAGSPGVVIPNDINIDAGGFRCGGTVDFEFSGRVNPINNALRGYGNYGLEGCDLTISGNIDLTAGNLQVEGSDNRDNGSWTFTGDITGPGTVGSNGAFDGGEITFSGNHSYLGTTVFNSGTVNFDATQTGGGTFTVATAATLAGSGSTTSAVIVNGTLTPGGFGVGTLATGALTINGPLVLDLDSNASHDSLAVTGAVTIGAASGLELRAGAGLSSGDLILIDNDDTVDAVSGTFVGLGEGTGFDSAASGWEGNISYAAGDSNDVGIEFDTYTTIGQWRADNFGDPANAGAGENGVMAANGLTNLQSFAFDLDPNAPAGTLDVDAGAGTITTLGPPTIWVDPATGRIFLRHTRRTDFASVPLTITTEFSRNPGLPFEVSTEAPTVIATGTGDGGAAIQAVQTEFPFALPISGGKGRYGRVDVTTP